MSALDYAAVDAATDALLGAQDDMTQGWTAARQRAWESDQRDVLVAAILDTGWTIPDALRCETLSYLLPDSDRERAEAQRAAQKVRGAWEVLTGDEVTPDFSAAARGLRRALVANRPSVAKSERVPTPMGEVGQAVSPPEMLPGEFADGLAYAKGLMVYFGEPEHGKSMVVQQLAADSIRAGRRVIHLDYEQGPDDAGASYRKLGLDPASAMASGLLHYEYLTPDDAIDFGWLDAEATEHEGLVVVVDSFSRAAEAAGISGTAYMEQGNLANALQAFGMRNDASVLMVDHSVKAPKKEERHAGGGPGKLGAARGQYFVRREASFSPEKVGRITLTRAKGRAPGLAERHEFAVGGEGLETFSFRRSGGVPVDRIGRDILAFLEGKAPQSRNAIRQSVTGNDKVINATIDTLATQGLLKTDAAGTHPKFGLA